MEVLMMELWRFLFDMKIPQLLIFIIVSQQGLLVRLCYALEHTWGVYGTMNGRSTLRNEWRFEDGQRLKSSKDGSGSL